MKDTKPVEIRTENGNLSDNHTTNTHSHAVHAEENPTQVHDDHLSPAQERKFKLEGWRVLLGGVLIHLVLGTFYLWGSISVYIASYLRVHNTGVTLDIVKMVFPLMNVAINASSSFGVKLAARIGHKLMMSIGIFLIAATVFVVSFITNFWAFLLTYAIVLGVSSGMVYMVPVVCGLRYFPTKKGRVSGIIIAGYGFGAFFFNLIALALINPNNVEPLVTVIEGGKPVSYFDESVYSRVPSSLRILSAIYISVGAIGCLLMKYPKSISPLFFNKNLTIELDTHHVEHHDEHEILTKDGAKKIEVRECHSVKEGLHTRQFYLLFFMVILAAFFSLFMANNYKIYGLTKINDDQFLTIVGSIGSAVNGFGRVFWGVLMDKFGFKRILFIILALQIILTTSINSIVAYKGVYLVWYALTMACEGGLGSIFLAVTAKIFGNQAGPLIYGFIFFGFALANVMSYFIGAFAQDKLGWTGIFWISFGFTIGAGVLNFLFNEKHKW